MCTKGSKTADTYSIQLKEKKTKNVCYRSCVFVIDLGLIISFKSEIVTKRPPSECFKTFGVIFFFLALETITIAVVNGKTSFMCELSVTCNALWE